MHCKNKHHFTEIEFLARPSECISLALFAKAERNKMKYNFQQRISWLSHRWRTQRNAICNVNCRIQWIIESLNAYCALWYSEEHACLSIREPISDPISCLFEDEKEGLRNWVLPSVIQPGYLKWRCSDLLGFIFPLAWKHIYLVPSKGLLLFAESAEGEPRGEPASNTGIL